MIFTERTITIRNDSSSINAPVILYRGDKNVEVRFTLVESPYKYSNRDSINIIESTDASYAQLVIKTPNGRDPIFGDITAVGQSNVIFMIGYDMIDEIEEVGTYDFQIRLFDADQTSMATIPEVTGGFIIKEPIAKEDTTNNITNSAIVGSAVVTSDVSIPTFVGGSYNKTAWDNGTVISRQKLDKIEDGIYETYELSKDNSSQIKDIAEKGTTVDVLERLTKEEIDRQIADGTIAALTIGDGTVGLNHLNEELLYIEKGNNLFTGTQTLNINGVDRLSSNFIETSALRHIVTNIKNYISYVYYDENKNVVKTSNTTDSGIITVDNNYKYITITDNGTLNFVDKLTYIINSNNRNDYIPDKKYINGKLVKDIDIVLEDKSVGLTKLSEDIITTIESNNLVKWNERIPNMVINGQNISNLTNWIPVKASVQYVSSLNYTQYYFFDANKTFISQTTFMNYPVVFSPKQDGYLLIRGVGKNTKVLEGTSLDAYYETYYQINENLINVKNNNKWQNKKWLCIGDSITTDNAGLATVGYGKLIAKDLGMNLTNVAASGKTMSYFYDLIDGYSEQFDLITVMLGTNNQGYNCNLGELNDSYYQAGTYNSNNSFYAQTQLMIEKLMTKYPKSKIIFLTPIKRTGTSESQKNNSDGYMINALNKTTKDYRDVIIDCCNYYSIPYVDLYNCIDPRTEINRTLYFMSATDGTHPNDLGHALFLAPIIKNEIEKQAPYFFNSWN